MLARAIRMRKTRNDSVVGKDRVQNPCRQEKSDFRMATSPISNRNWPEMDGSQRNMAIEIIRRRSHIKTPIRQYDEIVEISSRARPEIAEKSNTDPIKMPTVEIIGTKLNNRSAAEINKTHRRQNQQNPQRGQQNRANRVRRRPKGLGVYFYEEGVEFSYRL